MNQPDSQITGNLPTFIIGGAPRSGTTLLYRLLDAHRQIYLAKPVDPEPKFFLVNAHYAKGLNHYRQTWFADVKETCIGEKSTNYLESPAAAQRIAKDLPRVQMIFILRDPVVRAFSNYRWSVQNGLEDLPFDQAIELEPQRQANYAPDLRYARPFSYVSRGMYADLLAPWFDLFDASRIKIILLEELLADPQTVLNDLCAFLDTGPYVSAIDLSQPVNPAHGNKALPAEVGDKLRALYREPNQRLARILDRQLSCWP